MLLLDSLTLTQLAQHMRVEQLPLVLLCVLHLDVAALGVSVRMTVLYYNLEYQRALRCFDTYSLVKALISICVVCFFHIPCVWLRPASKR